MSHLSTFSSIKESKNMASSLHKSSLKVLKVDKISFSTIPITIKNDLHFLPQNISLTISNTNVSIANAVRRTVIDETTTKRLYFDISDLKTDDVFIISHFIQERTRCLPISQKIPVGTTFKMITRNSSAESKHIYSSQISGETTEKLCNDQFIILALNPGKYIEIKNIRVVEEYGYVNGTHNASYNCSLNPLDIDMEAEQSTNSNPTKFAISIDTNGNMGSKQFMKKCFSELKDRFLKINIDSLESSGNKHILKIYGESHSVGNILCYGMINLYPEIEFIAPSFPGNSHNVFINIIHRDAQELKELLREIIKNAIENFSVLSDACDKK